MATLPPRALASMRKLQSWRARNKRNSTGQPVGRPPKYRQFTMNGKPELRRAYNTLYRRLRKAGIDNFDLVEYLYRNRKKVSVAWRCPPGFIIKGKTKDGQPVMAQI